MPPLRSPLRPLIKYRLQPAITSGKGEATFGGLAFLVSARYCEMTGDELPPIDARYGRSGLELIRLTRELPHRNSLPILFFSIEDCEREAKAAGASAFLRKPHDLFQMVDTIRGLLEAVS